MKRIYLFIAICCAVKLLIAQQTAPVITLDEPLSGNQHYQAGEYIDMIPDTQPSG